VFCQIKLSAHGRTNLHEFIEAVSRIPEVLEIYSVMGSFDFLLKVVTGDVADFRQITFGRILTLPTVQECNSTIALGVEKLSTVLPIRAA
jgi:Lrp/AsnC family transcriptional regulator